MFGSLPLRARFLIAPIIGGLLTVFIYISSSSIIAEQKQLFEQINNSDLIQIGEINRTVAQLARNNSDIITLLFDSEALDEEQIYEQGKQTLNELHTIEQSLLATIEKSERITIDGIDIFAKIIDAYSTYRFEAVSAIEMSSVDTSQALYELALANKKLKVLNKLFLSLSEYHLQHITSQANEISGSLSEKTYINEISIVFIILIFAVAFYLSDKMSASLRKVYNALIHLAHGETNVTVLKVNDSYTRHLWKAAAEFKESLIANQAQKNELLMLKYAMNKHSIISIADLDGTITYANKKFRKISGYSNEELIGENHRIVNSGNTSKEYWQAMYRRIANGKTWHDEVLNQAKDGSLYWVDTSIIPIRASLDTGKIASYMSIRTDITARKEQEQRLIEATKEAEAATKAKSQFLANMSHEIRTPMNGVIGMTQLLQDTNLNNEQQNYLNAIAHSSDNLLSIINDILDFSKLEFDAVTLEEISFNLEQTCLDCLEVISSNSHAKAIDYLFDYHPDVPRYFSGDPVRVRQMLLNLLSNANKFTKQGYIRLTVLYIANNVGEEQLSIRVQDTGIGIKSNALNQLFEEFSQADVSTTRKYGGTGLGLSITKKLANLMLGTIDVHSQYQQGSTFTLTLPLAVDNAIEQRLAIPENLKDLPILLIDANTYSSNIFKGLFDHIGMKTTVMNSAAKTLSALQAADSHKPPYQLAVINSLGSEQSTIELAASIRANTAYNDLKLVLFSASPKKGEAVRYQQAQFSGYLPQLSSYDMIVKLLSASLSHHHGQEIFTRHLIKNSQLPQRNKQVLAKQTFTGNVLLVEDIKVNQVIAHKMLTSLGLNVDIASDGQEAVTAVNNTNYDLIFMDCQMPVMDGYQATQQIRVMEQEQSLAAMPIIALTANATAVDIITCKESKMDDVVTKPYQLADLQQCLAKWLPN